MDATKTCPDCGGAMHKGFVPDATYGAILQAHWYEGEPEDTSFFGIKTGLKVDRAFMHPIWAYRCIDCGRLLLYAQLD